MAICFGNRRCQKRAAEKQRLKYAFRTNKVEAKAETAQTAYKVGIDPQAAKWQGIAHMGSTAIGAATAIATKGMSSVSTGPFQKSVFGQNPNAKQENNNMLLILAGFAALLLIKR